MTADERTMEAAVAATAKALGLATGQRAVGVTHRPEFPRCKKCNDRHDVIDGYVQRCSTCGLCQRDDGCCVCRGCLSLNGFMCSLERGHAGPHRAFSYEALCAEWQTDNDGAGGDQ